MAQADVNPEERGWRFATRSWREVWPQGIESFAKVGKRLLEAIAAEAGGVGSITLTLCAHDPFQANTATMKPSKAPKQNTLCSIEVP